MFTMFAAGGRRVRYGAKLRDPGRSEHQAHAGAARPLPAEPAGELWALQPTIDTSPSTGSDYSRNYERPKYNWGKTLRRLSPTCISVCHRPS